MPEEGKTDSESSCSFFGKRKAVTRKNALCLRRKRTRKAVVSSSKKKSSYPKECIIFAEKTDSESSCLLFERESGYPKEWNFVCKKYTLRSFISHPRGRLKMKIIYLSPSSDSSQARQAGQVRMTRKGLSYAGQKAGSERQGIS